MTQNPIELFPTPAALKLKGVGSVGWISGAALPAPYRPVMELQATIMKCVTPLVVPLPGVGRFTV